jgi:hypothetical protein
MNNRQTRVATHPLMMKSFEMPMDDIQPTTPKGTPMEGMLRMNVTEMKASAVS